MTKEEMLALVAKSGITVQGDLVLEKHVENEIGNVEAGGIGIQIVHDGQKKNESHDAGLSDKMEDIVNQVTAMFYNDREEAVNFVKQIQNMKPTQMTALVNQLVTEKKLSDMSCHRDLWRVLHDNGLYTPSESNWNMQVK